MAQPIVLQDAFTRMIQDVPRDELPKDAAWLIQDWIPNLGLGEFNEANIGGRLSKRGGWVYASEDLALDASDASGATKITGMGYLPFANRLCMTTDNLKFGYIEPPGTGAATNFTLVSTSSLQSWQPYVEWRDLLVITGNDGTTIPKTYDGTNFHDITVTDAPPGQFAAVWKDRLLLGNTAANPRRTYFYEIATSAFDLTYGWIDTLQYITGYAVLPNVVLVFGANKTARIRGDIPPPGGNLSVDDPVFNVGCTFANSIAVNGPNCVFANEEGVFLTNGTSQVQDLTQICGVKDTWHKRAAQGFVLEGATAPGLDDVYGGFIGNQYLAAMRPQNYPDIAFLFDLTAQTCVVFTNIAAESVTMTPQIGDELYMGIGTRVCAMSYMMKPNADNKEDANGVDIEPDLETRYYLDTGAIEKTWKTGYLDYRLDDAASDNPTLEVSFTSEPQGTDYTSIDTLSETLDGRTIRAKMPMRVNERGVAFKIKQTGNSSMTSLTALLAAVEAREAGRVRTY